MVSELRRREEGFFGYISWRRDWEFWYCSAWYWGYLTHLLVMFEFRHVPHRPTLSTITVISGGVISIGKSIIQKLSKHQQLYLAAILQWVLNKLGHEIDNKL